MHGIYELFESYCKEMEGYAGQPVTRDNLAEVDTLAHAAKNLCKILEACEGDRRETRLSRDGGQGGSYRGGMRGGSHRGGSYRGGSYRRESMGRYSRENGYSEDGGMADQLREMMEQAPTESLRREMERLAEKMEQAEK